MFFTEKTKDHVDHVATTLMDFMDNPIFKTVNN